jgi:hypothetical protein
LKTKYRGEYFYLRSATVWRKFHNEEVHNLYSSPNIMSVIVIKDDEMGGTCGTHGTDNCIQNFSRKPKIEWSQDTSVSIESSLQDVRQGFNSRQG